MQNLCIFSFFSCSDFLSLTRVFYKFIIAKLSLVCISCAYMHFQYYAHREKLRHVGRENDLEAMNIAALKMAREVADDHGCLMAGNICNSTVYRTDVPETNNEVENIFKVADSRYSYNLNDLMPSARN